MKELTAGDAIALLDVQDDAVHTFTPPPLLLGADVSLKRAEGLLRTADRIVLAEDSDRGMPTALGHRVVARKGGKVRMFATRQAV